MNNNAKSTDSQANGTTTANTNGTATTAVEEDDEDWNTSFMVPPNWDETVNQPSNVEVTTKPIAAEV